MEIHSNVQLKTEVTPPADAKEKILLPGCETWDTGVSYSQSAVIRSFCLNEDELHLPDTTTWFVARAAARVELGLTPAQYDFKMVELILKRRYARSADNPLSDNQFNFLNTMVGALAGQSPHWAPGIQERVNKIRQTHRDHLVDQALQVKNGRDFTRLVMLWESFTGTRNTRIQDVQAPPIGDLTADAKLPSNAGEEPY